ncbi:hypothetical protein ACVJGD_006771 [Bradyrhizobium sp. USDA 10063]
MPGSIEQLSVSDFAPGAACCPLGHEHALGLDLGPMMQPIGDALRIIEELLSWAKIDRAIAAPLDGDLRIAERYRAQRMRGGIFD